MTSPIEVLLVEASADTAQAVAEALAGSADGRYDLTWVDSLDRGLERLRAGEPDLILLGAKLPDTSGAQALAAVRSQSPLVPVVILSAYGDEKLAASLVERGAEDYQVREQIEFGLAHTIRHAVSQHRLRRKIADLEDGTEKILSALDAGLFLLEPTARTVMRCNFTAEKIFGLPREEMQGRSLETLFPDRASFREFDGELQAAIDSIGHLRTERTLRRSMGETFPAACAARPIGRSGEASAILLSIEDISDRDRMRREAEARHRLALEIAAACLSASDEKALLRECCRLAVGEGGCPGAFAGTVDAAGTFEPSAQALRGLLEVPDPPVWADADRADGLLAECISRRHPVVGADVERNPRLQPYREEAAARGYQSLLALPLLDGETALGALVLCGERSDSFPPEVVADLAWLGRMLASAMARLRRQAAEREAAERCRQSEERLARMAQALPQVLCVSAVQGGRLLFISAAFSRLFGRSPEGLLGQCDPWREFIHPDDRRRVLEEIGAGSPQAVLLQYRIQRPDGAVRWIRERGLPASDGRSGEWVTWLEDVTADVDAAREEKARTERLLQVEKLHSASCLAEGLARPWSAQLEQLDLALKRAEDLLPLDHPALEALQPAWEAWRELQARVRRLQGFQAPGVRGRAPVDLNSVLRGALKATRKVFGDSRQLTWYCQDPLPSVEGAPDAIEQLVLDLLRFAAGSASPDAALVIETDQTSIGSDFCREHPQANAGDFVRLSLRLPDGPALPKARERMFEPFACPLTGEPGGDLALFSAHGIVRAHRGFIVCEFPEAGGLQLRVHLPASDEARITRAAAANPAQPGRRSALIVEADPATAALVQRLLEKENFFCLVAQSGLDGLDLAIRMLSQIELLVTQSDAIGLSGRELARRLRERKPEIKVLLLLPEAGDTQPDAPTEPGPDLRKPFSTQALRRALATLLGSGADSSHS
jgi:PAS domain S-box-containing protein